MIDTLSIRLARSGDLADIMALQRAAVAGIDPRTYSAEARDAWSRTTAADVAVLVAAGRYLAAERDGRLAGGAGWQPLDAPPQAAALRAVFVDPACHGQGVGAHLVRAAEAAIAAAGRRRILVPAALNAVGFYERLGYVANDDAIADLGGVGLRYRRMWKRAA